MKNATLIASALLALAAPTAAQQWSDNFDTYTGGQALFNVGGWTGWDNTAGAAGSVDSNRSRSFPNSLRGGPATDAVHPGLGVKSGKWRLTAWQYIATGEFTGDVYFVGNSVYNHGGPYSWTIEVQCDTTTGNVLDDLRAHTPTPVKFDRWVEYRFDIDLDANTMTTFYDGIQLSSGVYAASGPRALDNIDLFNNGGSCNWDDVKLEWKGDGFDTYAPATSLFNVGGWTGWDNTAGAAGVVDATRARTGANSILCGATADAVHPNIGITRGRWRLTAWQYIATGGLTNDVYFIVNNRYNHGGPYTWAIEFQCDVTTGRVLDDMRPHTPVPIVFDQWAEFRMDIDLDANTVTSFYNGTRLSQGPYALAAADPRAIQNIDLFNNGGTCNWDDVCIQEITSAPCFEKNIGVSLAMGDDATSVQPLGFTFPFTGGSTTDIRICSNGFIWLDTLQTSTDYSNSVAEFLGSVQPQPRIAACWRDFDATATGSDDVYYNALPDRAVITWHNVTRYNGSSPMTVQCQMLANGTVNVFFDANFDLTGGTVAEGRSLIGIKTGVGAVADPGNTDYSAALPISTTGPAVYEFIADSALFDLRGRCIRFEPNTLGGYDVAFRADCGASSTTYGAGCPAGTPVSMTTDAPPVLGSTFNWNVTNVPANTTAAALMLGVGNANTPLDFLGYIGCSSYTTMNLAVALPFTPPTAQLAGTVPINAQIIGMALYTQAVIVENTVTVTASNGVTLVFGKN